MALINLTRNADNIRGYMGAVWLFDPTADTSLGEPQWVDAGAVRNPQIEVNAVSREADSQGRTPVMAYDFNITFTLLDVDATIRNLIDANRVKGKIYFTKDASKDPNSASFVASDGFLIEGGWLNVNASINFNGEGDAFECSLKFRALPADAAALFNGTSNSIVLP